MVQDMNSNEQTATELLRKAVNLYETYGFLAQHADCGKWINDARALLDTAKASSPTNDQAAELDDRERVPVLTAQEVRAAQAREPTPSPAPVEGEWLSGRKALADWLLRFVTNTAAPLRTSEQAMLTRILVILTASPAPLPSGDGWREISSAPKNEYVLVFCPDAADYTQIMICGFLESEDPEDDGDWYELNCDTRPNPFDVEPTHWQPLPDSPLSSPQETI